MNLNELKNTQELQTFLGGTQAVAFSLPGNKSSRYRFIQSVLKQFHYGALNKKHKRTSIELSILLAQNSQKVGGCVQLEHGLHFKASNLNLT